MNKGADARAARDYVEELCQRIDRGERLTRIRRDWWRVAAGIPMVACLCLSASCGGSNAPPRDPAGRTTEVCGDGVDNDGDGRVDCGDPACAASCGQPWRGEPEPLAGPPEHNCADGLDDDGDGRVDCYDDDCAAFCSGAEYAAPAPTTRREGRCDDGRDGDGDGLFDCDDPDCESVCGGAEYAAPLPRPTREVQCGDGWDNDGDGLIDENDPDCMSHVAPLYAAPAEPTRWR